VIVAVDGSSASVRAMIWALRHAAEKGLRVEALTAWPVHGPVFVREVTGHFSEHRWRAREIQAEAVSRALAAVDDAPPHDLRVVNAEVVDALTRASARAVLVVVGSDDVIGRAGRTGRLTDRLRRALGDVLVVVGPEGPVDLDTPAAGGPIPARPVEPPRPR
jgi:hypothetical protein